MRISLSALLLLVVIPLLLKRNFLGEKRVRVVKARPGVTMVKSTDVKDEPSFRK